MGKVPKPFGPNKHISSKKFDFCNLKTHFFSIRCVKKCISSKKSQISSKKNTFGLI